MNEYAEHCLSKAAVTTTLKTVGAAASVLASKAIQSLDALTEEKIKQYIYNSAINYGRFKAETLKSCTVPPYSNADAKLIIKQLICLDINKKLNDDILANLAGILNQNGYYSMPITAYQEEKDAASRAVIVGAAGTALSSAVVDAGVASLASATDKTSVAINKTITAKPPPGHSSEVFGETLGITAGIGMPAAVGTAYFGIRTFKWLNSKIPKHYLPDINKLTTKITQLKQVFKESEPDFTKCVNETTKNVIADINETFNAEKAGVQKITYSSNIITKPMDVYFSDFDFTNNTFNPNVSKKKTRVNEFKGQIRDYCNQNVVKSGLIDVKKQIDNGEQILEEFFNAYNVNVNESETYISTLSPLVTPIIENLILEDIDEKEYEAASGKLKEAIEEAKRSAELAKPGDTQLLQLPSQFNASAQKALEKAQCFGEECYKYIEPGATMVSKGLAKGAESLTPVAEPLSKGINYTGKQFSSISSSIGNVFKRSGPSGGRKSRRLRKKRTQKRRMKTRNRH
jgi:hypothetical protein